MLQIFFLMAKAKQNDTSVARLRQQYGLTQQELALLLGVARSQMGLMELGKRRWPTGTTLKQLAMEPQMLPPISANLQSSIEAAQQQSQADWEHQQHLAAQKGLSALAALKQKLADFKTKEQQAINALRLAEKMKIAWQEPNPEQAAKDQIIWDNVITNAWVKIRDYGQGPQADLQEKITVLEAFINKWLVGGI